jgi:hypothetical protein
VLGGGAILAVTLASVWVGLILNCMSKSRLAIEQDVLVVRGMVTSGFGIAFSASERRFPLSQIAKVALGDDLLIHEQVRLMWQNRMIKRGRLVITETSGQKSILHFANRVFDPDKLASFLAELERRGVSVAGPTY